MKSELIMLILGMVGAACITWSLTDSYRNNEDVAHGYAHYSYGTGPLGFNEFIWNSSGIQTNKQTNETNH